MIILSITNHSESSASIYDTKSNILLAASEEIFENKKFIRNTKKTIEFLLSELKINLSKVDKIIYCSHESIYPSKKLQNKLMMK